MTNLTQMGFEPTKIWPEGQNSAITPEKQVIWLEVFVPDILPQ